MSSCIWLLWFVFNNALFSLCSHGIQVFRLAHMIEPKHERNLALSGRFRRSEMCRMPQIFERARHGRNLIRTERPIAPE